MSMQMTSKDLRELADNLDEIKGLSFDVKLIRVALHDVYLDVTDDAELVVVGMMLTR